MIGYTISPLDSNESILEKLNKLEKYLKDNKMYNLYTTSYVFYNTTDNIIPDASVNNIALNTISVGDLMLYNYNGATVVGTVIAVGTGIYTVDRTTEKVLFYDTQISSVTIIQPQTDQIKIEIIDTKGNLFESNIVTISGGGGGTGLVFLDVTWSGDSYPTDPEDIDTMLSAHTLQEYHDCNGIVLTNSAGTKYTLYKDLYAQFEDNGDNIQAFGFYNVSMDIGYQFNYANGVYNEGRIVRQLADIDNKISGLAGGTTGQVLKKTSDNDYEYSWQNESGGAETVYVDSNDSIVSSNATTTTTESVVLGDGAVSQGNWAVAVGVNATVRDNNGIAIGRSAETKNDGIAIGLASISRNKAIVIGTNANVTAVDTTTNDGIAIGHLATISGNYCTAIGDSTVAGTDEVGTHTAYCTAIGYGAKAKAEESVQIGSGTNNTPYSIQFKTEQILSKDTSNDPIKLSNNLQLDCVATPIIITSMTNDFATASSNGIQVTVDSNDSAHEQVSLYHLASDSSILENKMVLAIYNYTDMTDPNNPVTEYTWCMAMFDNYDSNDNVCDCMLMKLAPSQTM